MENLLNCTETLFNSKTETGCTLSLETYKEIYQILNVHCFIGGMKGLMEAIDLLTSGRTKEGCTLSLSKYRELRDLIFINYFAKKDELKNK